MAAAAPYIIGLLAAIVIIMLIQYLERFTNYLTWRRNHRPYPTDHTVAAERVVWLIDLVAADPETHEDRLIEALTDRGLPPLDARLLVRLVPIAFAWALLQKAGVNKFPSKFAVLDDRQRRKEYPFSNEHYFSTALGIAMQTTSAGFTDRVTEDAFVSLASRSAEWDAFHHFSEANPEPDSAKSLRILTPTFFDLTHEELANRKT
jgi:hypothetical protein